MQLSSFTSRQRFDDIDPRNPSQGSSRDPSVTALDRACRAILRYPLPRARSTQATPKQGYRPRRPSHASVTALCPAWPTLPPSTSRSSGFRDYRPDSPSPIYMRPRTPPPTLGPETPDRPQGKGRGFRLASIRVSTKTFRGYLQGSRGSVLLEPIFSALCKISWLNTGMTSLRHTTCPRGPQEPAHGTSLF